MQLQMFNTPPKKKDLSLFATISASPEYAPTSAEQLLSERFITQNGMLLLRQGMASAYRQGNWKNYLQLVRSEIDFKKGRITMGQVLRGNMLGNMR